MSEKYVRGLIPSILMHLGLGGIYSWSQLTNKIASDMGVDESSIHLVFISLVIIMGISAMFSDLICRKLGLKTTLGLGSALFLIGMLMSSFSINIGSLSMLILGYGVISSIGMGLCYLVPLKNLILWFPESSGLPIGLTICSFNISGFISSGLVYLLYQYNSSLILTVLMMLGITPMLIGLFLIKRSNLFDSVEEPNTSKEVYKIVTNWRFIIVWLILCMKLSAGLMIFYNMISIANYSFTAFDYSSIILIALSSAILCSLGKLSAPWISDFIRGSKLKINYYIFGLPIIIMIIAYFYHDWSIIPFVILISSFMYGSGLSCIPIILKEVYGFKYLGTIQGLMFTSWCVAGVLGAKLGKDLLNNIGLNIVLSSATIMYILGLILSMILIYKVKEVKNKV